MDDDDWSGKAAVDAVRTALMGWDGTTTMLIVAEALRRIPPDLDTHLRRAGACALDEVRGAPRVGLLSGTTPP